jgi:hypothetical protein
VPDGSGKYALLAAVFSKSALAHDQGVQPGDAPEKRNDLA